MRILTSKIYHGIVFCKLGFLQNYTRVFNDQDSLEVSDDDCCGWHA